MKSLINICICLFVVVGISSVSYGGTLEKEKVPKGKVTYGVAFDNVDYTVANLFTFEIANSELVQSKVIYKIKKSGKVSATSFFASNKGPSIRRLRCNELISYKIYNSHFPKTSFENCKADWRVGWNKRSLQYHREDILIIKYISFAQPVNPTC